MRTYIIDKINLRKLGKNEEYDILDDRYVELNVLYEVDDNTTVINSLAVKWYEVEMDFFRGRVHVAKRDIKKYGLALAIYKSRAGFFDLEDINNMHQKKAELEFFVT